MHGRLNDARDILFKVSNTRDEAELRLRLGEIEVAAGIVAGETGHRDGKTGSRGEGVYKELLLRPSLAVRCILIAAIRIHFFEHVTGIEAAVLYTQ